MFIYHGTVHKLNYQTSCQKSELKLYRMTGERARDCDCDNPIYYLIHIFMLFSNFTDSDIIRTCAQWVIVQCGGSGTNGKKTSIGWPLMGLILPLLLMRKKRSGKDYIKN